MNLYETPRIEYNADSSPKRFPFQNLFPISPTKLSVPFLLSRVRLAQCLNQAPSRWQCSHKLTAEAESGCRMLVRVSSKYIRGQGINSEHEHSRVIRFTRTTIKRKLFATLSLHIQRILSHTELIGHRNYLLLKQDFLSCTGCRLPLFWGKAFQGGSSLLLDELSVHPACQLLNSHNELSWAK